MIQTEEDTVICLHSEYIDRATHIGTCKLCGQERYYDPWNKAGVQLLKRGHIDGKLTMVTPPSGVSKVPVPAVKKEGKPMARSTSKVEEHSVPPRPKKWKLRAKYYEDNKDAIIADYYSIHLRDFFKRWHLSVTTWMKLKKLWSVAPKSPLMSRPPRQHASPPLLPLFNNGWNFIVQIEWLKTYKELKIAGKL